MRHLKEFSDNQSKNFQATLLLFVFPIAAQSVIILSSAEVADNLMQRMCLTQKTVTYSMQHTQFNVIEETAR